MKTFKNNREDALKWWSELTTEEKIFITGRIMPDRNAFQLTGKEIEKIYNSPSINPSNTTDNDKTFMVYNRYTIEVEFEGSIEKCHDFIANYGGGWWALEIGPKYSAE